MTWSVPCTNHSSNRVLQNGTAIIILFELNRKKVSNKWWIESEKKNNNFQNQQIHTLIFNQILRTAVMC